MTNVTVRQTDRQTYGPHEAACTHNATDVHIEQSAHCVSVTVPSVQYVPTRKDLWNRLCTAASKSCKGGGGGR